MDITGLGSVAELATSIVNRIWPDANEAEKAKISVMLAEYEALRAQSVAQAEVNKVEASSDLWFVSAARPAMLWICVLIMFYSYIFYPTVGLIAALAGSDLAIPPLAVDEPIWNLIFGTLGVTLIGARTVEKVHGVARGATR